MKARKRKPVVAVNRFLIFVDGREKAPYRFDGLTTDAKDGSLPLIVSTAWQHLKTGDYTIEGYESEIAVERKSLADLYTTLGSNRERFEREHERLAEIRFSCVVIEAAWSEILLAPPDRSQLNPKTVFRTSLSWFVRYGVPWFAMEDRRLAERFTFQFLAKAWRQLRREADGQAKEVSEGV